MLHQNWCARDQFDSMISSILEWYENLGSLPFTTDFPIPQDTYFARLDVHLWRAHPDKGPWYHTLFHCKAVAYFATEYHGKNCLELILAGLFHDYGHSLGKQPDSINVQKAVAGFLAFNRMYPLAPEQADTVARLIFCTEYPYKVDPNGHLEQALRDADLSMSRIDRQHWFPGLCNEMGMENTDATWVKNLEFLQAQTYHTPIAKDVMGQTLSQLRRSCV